MISYILLSYIITVKSCRLKLVKLDKHSIIHKQFDFYSFKVDLVSYSPTITNLTISYKYVIFIVVNIKQRDICHYDASAVPSKCYSIQCPAGPSNTLHVKLNELYILSAFWFVSLIKLNT